MGIKEFNPYTPSRRFITIDDKKDITKETPEKSLIQTLRRTGGRNNTGRITSRFITGGHKKQYRVIDFKRDKKDIEGVITAIEYDPNRNCRIALIQYKDGERRYIIAPLGLNVSDKIIAAENPDIKAGNAMPLKNMPDGTVVHNIELTPGRGGQMARSAGAFAQIMGKEGDHVILKMPSSELRKIRKDCWATIGQVGNLEHENIVVGKAGKSRWLGIRPATRAIVKNPCDHPMGGGEGKSKSGQHPVSPTNVKAKGFKTRNRKKLSSSLIITRRKI